MLHARSIVLANCFAFVPACTSAIVQVSFTSLPHASALEVYMVKIYYWLYVAANK